MDHEQGINMEEMHDYMSSDFNFKEMSSWEMKLVRML